MRNLILNEWSAVDVPLTADTAIAIRSGPGDIAVAPVGSGLYRLTPSHYVGSIRLPELSLIIQPKIDLDRLFFLLGFARNLRFDADRHVGLDQQAYLTEAFIRVFLDEAQRLLRRGPLMSYLSVDESSTTFRGRLRVADQLRRRFAMPLPAETTYDEFTVDIPENRILRAALLRASRLKLYDRRLRRRIAETTAALEGVADAQYDSRSMPRITFTRLNRDYATSVELARLIIAGTSVDLFHGSSNTPTFLIDMDKVFEDFVYRALELELAKSGRDWRQGLPRRLDEAGRVTIKPDLSLWQKRTCVFVGDVKYKRTGIGENDDLYQLLAYCKALGVPGGLLVYASAGQDETAHEVRRDGTTITVRSIDLEGTEAEILARIRHLASVIETMADHTAVAEAVR